MADTSERIDELEARIRELEEENAQLRSREVFDPKGSVVSAPEEYHDVFASAQKIVRDYFSQRSFHPEEGTININGERFVLMRSGSLSYEFLNRISELYADQGEARALEIGRNLLFDLAHVVGIADARRFHRSMRLKKPLDKLSVGPVHFAFMGWGTVEILPESKPSPDQDFVLWYLHHNSFESDAWKAAGKRSYETVCIMNAGYSSGWCEESYGIPLTAVEVTCRARGEHKCKFVMAPPHRINEYLEDYAPGKVGDKFDIPIFFERKRTEDKLKAALKEKEMLLHEIHHRVKNNLQVIISLLNVQSSYIEDPKARRLFELSTDRVKAMALVHEKLQQHGDRKSVNMSDYMRSIVQMVNTTYGQFSNNVKVVIDIDPDLGLFDIDKATPCGLIVNELISNVYKHAFPSDKEDAHMELRVGKKRKKYFIEVIDNGVGIPPEVDLENLRTLGLDLVQMMAEQVGGKMEVFREDGTRIRVEFGD